MKEEETKTEAVQTEEIKTEAVQTEEKKTDERNVEKTGENARKENNQRIIIFLALTFVITYAIEIFLISPMARSTDVNQAMLAQSLVSGVMFVPAVCALLTRLITKEKLIGSNAMLGIRLKGKLKYYALAWLGTVAMIVFGTVLYYLIFRDQFDPKMGYAMALMEAQAKAQNASAIYTADQLKQDMLIQILMGIFLSPLLNFFNCFGEEWGWRGYLLPKMLKNYKVVPTIIISGLIWGIWHAPLIVLGHNYGIGYAGYPFLGIFAMCMFCVAVGAMLSYVTIKTGSCIPAIIGHGTLNGFSAISICFISTTNPGNIFLGPSSVGLIGGMGFILLAVILTVALYKDEKQKLADGRRKLL